MEYPKKTLKVKEDDEDYSFDNYKAKYGFNPEEVLEIDLNNLDKEAKNHSKYMGKMIRIYKSKFVAWKNCVLELDILEDECAGQVRKSPTDYGITKDHQLTDSLVNRTIYQYFPELVKLKKKKIRIEAEQIEWENYVSAMRSRSENIKTAARLWELGYFDLSIRDKAQDRKSVRD